MIANLGELLEAFDETPTPFEMAVLDSLGRVGIVWADEDGEVGILRLAYEDEPLEPVGVTESDFPMIRLTPDPAIWGEQ